MDGWDMVQSLKAVWVILVPRTCMRQLGNGYDAVMQAVQTVQQAGIAER